VSPTQENFPTKSKPCSSSRHPKFLQKSSKI